MIRLIFRLLALVALSMAVILCVQDATRSVADSSLVLTPLFESWSSASPETLDWLRAAVTRHFAPLAWDPLALWILRLPGALVFVVLAFLFHAIGYRARRPNGGYAL